MDKGREGHWNNKNITRTGVKMACSAQTHPTEHPCFINDKKFLNQQFDKEKEEDTELILSLDLKRRARIFFAL